MLLLHRQRLTNRPLLDTLTELTEATHQYHRAQEAHYQDGKYRDCHRAFKTSNYEDHKNINPDRVDGTCRWVLDHTQFKDWRDRPRTDLLWISADPGCGKSVLAKSLIDHDLKTSSLSLGQSLCYFFFKDNATQNDLGTALCAILHQLFVQQPSMIRHALPAWERDGDHIKNEVDQLWRILEDVAADPETKLLTCVIDALDECRDSDRPRLIAKLCDIYKNASGNTRDRGSFKFLVTSRAYHTIQEGFQAVSGNMSRIRLRGEDENDQIHQEIDQVISQLVAKMGDDLSLATRIKQRIEQTLRNMEHRTYLWLHLTIGEIRTRLRDSFRPEEVPVSALPASVEEAYDQILRRITDEQRDTVKKIFSIILGARRALTVAEMALALGVTSEAPFIKSLSDVAINETHLERNIQQWCGLFTFINHSRIYPIHQTAKEFLLRTGDSGTINGSSWKHCLHQVETERIMSRICVSLLLAPDLEECFLTLEEQSQDSFENEMDLADETACQMTQLQDRGSVRT